jgi:hypothetical protein
MRAKPASRDEIDEISDDGAHLDFMHTARALVWFMALWNSSTKSSAQQDFLCQKPMLYIGIR